jgi:hypothetical protein
MPESARPGRYWRDGNGTPAPQWSGNRGEGCRPGPVEIIAGLPDDAQDEKGTKMSLGELASVVLTSLAVLTLIVAWRQWQEVVRRRQADMYWRIFDVYESDQIRDSSGAFDEIEDRLGLERADGLVEQIASPRKEELSSEYWKTFYRADRESDDNRRDRLARARIRFFAATGVLLKAELVDRDLVFGLIGPALDVDRRLLDIVITANRAKHEFPAMYNEVYYVDAEYLRWKEHKKPHTEATKGA